jgi:hypothetical protein
MGAAYAISDLKSVDDASFLLSSDFGDDMDVVAKP